MLKYEFEKVAACKGVFVGKSLEHREIILRRAAAGWRLCCGIPAEQANGFVTSIDLVFEKEEPEE